MNSTTFSIETSLSTSSIDRGHRLGNFHNYYTFHPPINRIGILTSCGVMNYILQHILLANHNQQKEEDEDVIRETKRSKPNDNDANHKEEEKDKQQQEEEERSIIFRYCDLGCNEGDLTMEFVKTLYHLYIQQQQQQQHSQLQQELSIQFLGLDIDPILIQRANEKLKPTLIVVNNSNEKKKKKKKELDHHLHVLSSPHSYFRECNLCNASSFNSIIESFFAAAEQGKKHHNSNKKYTTTTTTEKKKESSLSLSSTTTSLVVEKAKQFDVTTIFSTTMWIHVHSGDDGLTSFLKRACDITRKLLIVEPQPSKCYRNINTRLRKMNQPEIPNISTETLQMRHAIETEVERVIVSCGFRRLVDMKEEEEEDDDDTKKNVVVVVDNDDDAEETTKDGKSKSENRTQWNRMLQFYERI
mmetsp:Transcript_2464/g.3567  ORF Transcript_2464/g.3567 Transcript_2464/m.3567 type:complete len:414 (-) Transcript_2464:142-1383(-)